MGRNCLICSPKDLILKNWHHIFTCRWRESWFYLASSSPSKCVTIKNMREKTPLCIISLYKAEAMVLFFRHNINWTKLLCVYKNRNLMEFSKNETDDIPSHHNRGNGLTTSSIFVDPSGKFSSSETYFSLDVQYFIICHFYCMFPIFSYLKMMLRIELIS